MSTNINTVQDYAIKPPVQRAPVRTFGERLGDAHRESVTAGAIGPIVLLTSFLSSTFVLLYQGCSYLYRRCSGRG